MRRSVDRQRMTECKSYEDRPVQSEYCKVQTPLRMLTASATSTVVVIRVGVVRVRLGWGQLRGRANDHFL